MRIIWDFALGVREEGWHKWFSRIDFRRKKSHKWQKIGQNFRLFKILSVKKIEENFKEKFFHYFLP